MARIRTIKPEFWTDEKIMESSPMARLLLIGVLNFADDKGNIEAGPLSIKAIIFPSDNIDVGPLLHELEANQLLIPYSVNGESYYNIRGFLKHQKIDNPSKPRCPLYDPSATPPLPLTEDSTQEGKGKEVVKELKPIEHPKPDAPNSKENFEYLWGEYPEKKGKEKAWIKFKNQVKTSQDYESICVALPHYKADVEHIRNNGQPDLQWQYGSTWFNNNWKDYVDYKPPEKKHPSCIQPRKSKDRQELKEHCHTQLAFVEEEVEEDSGLSFLWFHMALDMHVIEYEQRFGESPFDGDSQGSYEHLKDQITEEDKEK